MTCSHCSKDIPTESQFCKYCGHAVKVNASAGMKEVKTASSPLDVTVKVVGAIIGFALGKFLGLVIFLFIGAFVIGQWFPTWYLKRERINVNVVKWSVWSNVATWFLPPLGILTGFAALEFSNHFPGERKKYKTLAIFGIVASLINATIGVLIRL